MTKIVKLDDLRHGSTTSIHVNMPVDRGPWLWQLVYILCTLLVYVRIYW